MAKAVRSALVSVPVPGPDGGWRDGIHPDAIRSQPGREVDRQRADSCFRGRVGLAAESGEGVDRANVDDRGTLGAAPQVRNGCPTTTDDTEKIEFEHADPYLVLRLLEPTVLGVAAGHVDHDVDSTEFGGCVG